MSQEKDRVVLCRKRSFKSEINNNWISLESNSEKKKQKKKTCI